MSNFPEPSTPGFVPVYQLKRTDAVDAGAAGDGPSNLPIKNLVERTAYLKKEVEDLDTAFGGVVIGSTVQAYDSDLQAIAALTTTGLIDRTGAGTAATRETGATGLAVLASADASAARTAIGAMANTAPEIITNANGTAYRWPNGLQICVIQIDLNYSNTTTFEALWTYPAAFTTNSISHCFLSLPVHVQSGGNGPSWNSSDARKVGLFGALQNPTSAVLRILSITGQTFATGYISCQAAAIGTYTP